MSKKLQQHLREIQKRGALFRAATVGVINVEERTVELGFSSETEKVERWFGIEVLGHDAGEIDLSRMNNNAPLCWMHNLHDQRGVVVDNTARVDGDRIARCTVRFSRSGEGEKLFQDVIDGITTKVSVGYYVTGMRLVEERDGMDVYRITAWQPYEVSLVSAAADDDMGVGRSLENPPEEATLEQVENLNIIKNDPAATRQITKDKQTMKYRTFTDAQGNQCRVAINDAGEDVGAIEIVSAAGSGERAAAQRGTDSERTRSAAILAMADQYAGSIPSVRELAGQMVRDGKTVTDMQDALLKAFNERAAKPLSEQNANADVGLSDTEVRRYSFMNVVRALANPTDAKAQKAAAFEIECGVAAERTLGRTAQGILVPPDVLSRAMNAGGAPGNQVGAQMIDNDVMRGSFIDLLRNRCIGMQLATVIAGLVGNVDIPKKTADGQAYWLGEDQDASETGFSLGQISFSPKTLGAYTEITRRLMQQSSMGVEAMVRSDLINSLGQAIDKAFWYGTGGEYQPLGLKNQSGINAVDFAIVGKPTFAELVQMETEIAADNADIGSMAYVGNSRFRGHAKTTLRFPGVNGANTIWEQGGTVNGYRTEITNQLVADDVFHGQFADAIIALWGGLDLTVDPFSLSKKGGVRIVAFQDVDTGLRRKESICWGSAAVN
ncbi:phage major capsid protein [Massilia sp. DJPM01]|uniref:phage major capsid protein n=1 Tax=Massilia sp. DJPM01 TaxID=3024404 RepID=UPI00259E4115|nr:phage major capsid protein [Massilia sp. DJPM01]MDM5178508.1 phage major capsid protein [Massilia sp. DJPM01]